MSKTARRKGISFPCSPPVSQVHRFLYNLLIQAVAKVQGSGIRDPTIQHEEHPRSHYKDLWHESYCRGHLWRKQPPAGALPCAGPMASIQQILTELNGIRAPRQIVPRSGPPTWALFYRLPQNWFFFWALLSPLQSRTPFCSVPPVWSWASHFASLSRSCLSRETEEHVRSHTTQLSGDFSRPGTKDAYCRAWPEASVQLMVAVFTAVVNT